MRDTKFQELDLDYFDHNPPVSTKVRPDFWQRMSRVMEVFLYILIFLALGRIFLPEIQRQRDLNAELEQIREVSAARQARVAQLRMENEWLKGDQEYIESIARDRLNLFRPAADEFVVRIERETDSADTETD